MDLKFKSTKWVGNIYHKFEAMCQEVDDFVSQDTVNYVENQAQAVGGTVKRFYSNVVHDLLPSSLAQPEKREAQAPSPKQNDTIGSYIKTMMGIEEKKIHRDINQSCSEQEAISASNDAHGHFNHQHCTDLIGEADTVLSSGPEVDVLNDKKSAVILEENNTKGELKDKKSNAFFEKKDTKVVLMGKTSYTLEQNDLNEELMSKDANDVEENYSKKEPSEPELLDLSCPKNKDLLEASLSSESIDEEEGIRSDSFSAGLVCKIPKDEVRSSTYVADVEFTSDISSSFPPSEMNNLVGFAENKTAESGLVSSSSSLSSESIYVPHNEENICYNLLDVIGFAPDFSDAVSSSQPSPILSCDDRVTDTKLDFSRSAPSLESNDADIPSTGDIAALVASFEDSHEYCNDCTQLAALMSSLKIGDTDDCRVDITDPSMETIELSEKTKLDESCVIVENKLLYSMTCKSQIRRSYKKILQDAFASRKRLRKEYEQLGIMFGDISTESSQQPGDHLFLQIPFSSSGSKKSSSSDLCEWELL